MPSQPLDADRMMGDSPDAPYVGRHFRAPQSEVDEAIEREELFRRLVTPPTPPPSATADFDALMEARVRRGIDDYLTSLHASQWGRGYEVSSPVGRQRAIDFIYDTIIGVGEHLD